MKRDKSNRWWLIPSKDPADQLYNRRLISYFSLGYSAVWFQQVLVIVVMGIWMDRPVDTSLVVALLGVPATLAGLGFYKYLQACKSNDKDQTDPPGDGEQEKTP